MENMKANSPSRSLLCSDDRPAIEGSRGKWWNGGLHAHLDGLEGAQCKVGDELSGRASREIQARLVAVRCLGAGNVGVELLEELVTAVFQGALGRIAEEGRRPAGHDATKAFGARDGRPRLEVARVHLGIDLASTLDKIERREGRVSGSLEGSALIVG